MDDRPGLELADAELDPYRGQLETVIEGVDDRYADADYAAPDVVADADLSDREDAAGVYRGRAGGRATVSVQASDRAPDAFAHELGHDASHRLGMDAAGGCALVDKTLDELTAYLTQYDVMDRTRDDIDTVNDLDPFAREKEAVFEQVEAAADRERLQRQKRLLMELRSAYDAGDQKAIEDVSADLHGTGIGYQGDDGRERPATNLFLEHTAYADVHAALSSLPRLAALETQEDVEQLYREAHGMTTAAGRVLKQQVDQALMDHEPYVQDVMDSDDPGFYADQEFCCEYLDAVWEQARDEARQQVLDRLDEGLQEFWEQSHALDGGRLRHWIGSVTYGTNADGSERYTESFDAPHYAGEALADRLYRRGIGPAAVVEEPAVTADMVSEAIETVFDHWLGDADGPAALDAVVDDYVEDI